MSSRRRLVEWAKTAMIALLCALAVFLGGQTGLFNDFFRSIPLFSALAGALRDSQGTPPPAPGLILSEAARPTTILITGSRGSHYGVRYDTGALSRIYERTSSVFSEALGSASPPEEITEEDWRRALSSPGVYFEYASPVRLAVLAGWLGVRPSDALSDHAARRVCVTFTDGSHTLYFESGGGYLACGTATPGGTPSGFIGYDDNGARFAFETGLDFGFAPYAILMPGTEHPALLAESPLTLREMVDAVLAPLGVTGQLESSYLRRGDTLVFIMQPFTVTASPGGRVTVKETSGKSGDALNEAQMIERARVAAAEPLARASGIAQVYFDTIERSGLTSVVTFRYHAAGGLIHLYESGYAARVTFTDGAITEMELIFRTYSLSETGELVSLYPEVQALAAAGTQFALCYPDGGGTYLRPIWAKAEVG